MSDRTALLEKRSAKALDDALNGVPSADPGVTELLTVANLLRDGLNPEVPVNRTERAVFMQGVGAAPNGAGWMRFFGPATVAAVVILIAVMLGRSALPGQAFYPVRQALRAVGLAPYSLEEMDGQVATASRLLDRAEAAVDTDVERARGLAFEAVKVLGFVEQTLPEVASDQAKMRLAEVQLMLTRAQDILITDPRDRVKGKQTGATDVQSDEPGEGHSQEAVRSEKHRGKPAHNPGKGTEKSSGQGKAQGTEVNGSRKGEGGGHLGNDSTGGDEQADDSGSSSDGHRGEGKNGGAEAKEEGSADQEDDGQEDDSVNDDDQGSDDGSEVEKELKKVKGHTPEKTLPGDDATPGHRGENGRSAGDDGGDD